MIVEDKGMIRESSKPSLISPDPFFNFSMPNGAYKTEALERGYVDEANTNLGNPG